MFRRFCISCPALPQETASLAACHHYSAACQHRRWVVYRHRRRVVYRHHHWAVCRRHHWAVCLHHHWVVCRRRYSVAYRHHSAEVVGGGMAEVVDGGVAEVVGSEGHNLPRDSADYPSRGYNPNVSMDRHRGKCRYRNNPARKNHRGRRRMVHRNSSHKYIRAADRR
jgi:hypothetical protein